MTFFSRAASICSQGFKTVAGEIANAMEPILACVTCVLPVRFIRGVWATALSRRKILLCAQLQITDYLVAAGLPLKMDLGVRDEPDSVGRWETFLNGPKISTFSDHCNAPFT
jgi:hypothetical protein